MKQNYEPCIVCGEFCCACMEELDSLTRALIAHAWMVAVAVQAQRYDEFWRVSPFEYSPDYEQRGRCRAIDEISDLPAPAGIALEIMQSRHGR